MTPFKFELPVDDANTHYGEYHAILMTAIQNFVRRPEHWQDTDYEAAMEKIDTLIEFLNDLANEFP